MEQDPQNFYNRQEAGNETPQGRSQSPEHLLPKAPGASLKAQPGSKSFEQLVHEALEEELKYERDPALRNQASQRADEILAEFQEARNLQSPSDNGDQNASEGQKDNNELTPELAKQLGIKRDNSKQTKPAYPGSNLNVGLPDLVMALVIAVLLIIVILLLIF